jgi:hypothetical protein
VLSFEGMLGVTIVLPEAIAWSRGCSAESALEPEAESPFRSLFS